MLEAEINSQNREKNLLKLCIKFILIGQPGEFKIVKKKLTKIEIEKQKAQAEESQHLQ